MATTTRTDVSPADTLLRIHTVEEVLKWALAEIQALKDGGVDPTPGEPGDQERIYRLTYEGSQTSLDEEGWPDFQTVYDDTRSLHQSVWSMDTRLNAQLANGQVRSILELLVGDVFIQSQPAGFMNSTWSLLTLLLGRPTQTEVPANDFRGVLPQLQDFQNLFEDVQMQLDALIEKDLIHDDQIRQLFERG